MADDVGKRAGCVLEPQLRVLVAVDFSPHAARAFAAARGIAPQAELHLVHVYEAEFEGKMTYAGVAEELIEEYRAAARRDAETQMARFTGESDIGAGNVHRHVEYGYAPFFLPKHAHKLEADLVVVGRHGKSLTEEMLLGSVTLHLLAQCECDVLVVR